MPNFTLDPNMGFPIPTVGVDPSPTWANDLNAALTIIGAHDHTSGNGVAITPAALNINSDLSIQSHNLTFINSLEFAAAIVGTPTVLTAYTNGTDLFYKDVNGVAIQLTKAGGPNAGTGNIQNLPSTPSGGAGISWVNAQSTFQFLSDAGTVGANVDAGTYILRYPGSYPTPSGNFIALKAPASLATGFSITLPATTPASQSFLTMDNSGVVAAPIAFANGITASNIAPATITGTQIVSNINLPGDAVQVDGKNIIASASNATKGLLLIRGQAAIVTDSSGNVTTANIALGEGFTLSHTGTTNLFTVTFTSPFFGDTPTCTGNVEATSLASGAFVFFANPSTSSVQVGIFHNPSSTFVVHFHMIGQRA